MERISKNNYRNYISWAKENNANMVYPCSIAEGIQPGDIYVNDDTDLKAVFFWHYCGFGFISGEASDKFLSDIYSETILNHNARRLVLVTSDADVIAFFRDRDVPMDSRVEYSYLHRGSISTINRNDIQIEQINSENIPKIQGKIIPSFSWESPEEFLNKGFGYIAHDQGRVCAVAFSAAVSSAEIDIGVETHEEYRRRGLAAILADRMCEHIIEMGKKPVWAHSISNKGSMNTALKCGFIQNRINTVIKKKDS